MTDNVFDWTLNFTQLQLHLQADCLVTRFSSGDACAHMLTRYYTFLTLCFIYRSVEPHAWWGAVSRRPSCKRCRCVPHGRLFSTTIDLQYWSRRWEFRTNSIGLVGLMSNTVHWWCWKSPRHKEVGFNRELAGAWLQLMFFCLIYYFAADWLHAVRYILVYKPSCV